MTELRYVGYIGIADLWNQAIFFYDEDHWTADFYLSKNNEDQPRLVPLPVAWEIEPAFP